MGGTGNPDDQPTSGDGASAPSPTGDLVALAPPLRLRAALIRFWPLLRPYSARLVLIGLASIIEPALATATTWLFKIMIDNVIVPGALPAFWPVAAGFAVLAVLQGVVSFGEHYTMASVVERFALALRSKLFAHLHDLTPDFFERRSLGDTLTRVNSDVDAVKVLIPQVSQALNHICLMVFFGTALCFLDWQLTLAAIVATPCIAVLAQRFSQRIRVASRERGRLVGSIGGITEESLANVALVRAYGRRRAEQARFLEQNTARLATQMTITRLDALFEPLAGLMQLAGTLAVFGLTVWEIGHHHITIGGFLAFITYLGRVVGPVQDFGELTNRIFSGGASAERVIELLDEQPAVVECEHPISLAAARGHIRWNGVTFTYPTSTTCALKDIELSASPGEKIAIVGASGAGKTTMAKLMLRFYDPDSGSITLDGIDLRSLTLEDLYRNIAVMLQETLVFDGTIAENISWGKLGATAGDVEQAAKAADAHQFITQLPDGYDTRIGQRGRLLSGGQRQRIAIARALIRDAPVLILDEPMTGLDTATTNRVLAPLKRLMHGRTTIIISHSLLTVADADRIILLDAGHIVGTGTHPELLQSNTAYATLYGLHHQPTITKP